jgi:hypothetical protein
MAEEENFNFGPSGIIANHDWQDRIPVPEGGQLALTFLFDAA